MKLVTKYVVALSAASAGLAVGAQEFKCTPYDVLMTRAVGTKAEMFLDPSTGQNVFTPKYELNNVNLASVSGSLKFIITETIDWETGVDKINCARKNNVNYIDFYLFTVCTPANATWWFSPLKPATYGASKEGYDYHGFGKYLTFDAGLCNPEQEYCDYLYGTGDVPKLGQWVGWMSVEDDVRNPTSKAYWYSAPGSCPMRPWSPNAVVKTAKDDKCNKQYPSGLCPPGTKPDGVKCTYSYDFLGEIDVSSLAGITDLGYATYADFCKAGNKEFVRSGNYSFVEGLPFWEDPLNQTRNALRIEAMLQHYNNKTLYPNNKALPSAQSINTKNPPCYCVTPACTADKPCAWDSENVCVACTPGSQGCEGKPDYSKCKGNPQQLKQVAIPASSSNGSKKGGSKGSSSGGSKDDGSGGGDESAAVSSTVAPLLAGVMTVVAAALL